MESSRWKEFEIRVEAYRHYLNIALQTNVFFYAITGATLGFYLKEAKNLHLVFVLLMPILIAAVLGSVFLYSATLQKRASSALESLREDFRTAENAHIKAIPDLELLYILLKIFGWIFYIVGAALIVAPFLKGAPFKWGKVPETLLVFAIFGVLVLVLVGVGTYDYAFYHDKKTRREEEKTESPSTLAPSGPVRQLLQIILFAGIIELILKKLEDLFLKQNK